MSDDALLKALASEAHRQERQLDPRLDRLVQGTLADKEAAALREQAAGDTELALALELFEPVGAEAHERFTAGVEAMPHSATGSVAGRTKHSSVVPLRRRPIARLGAAVAAPLALAAGLIFWLQTQPLAPLPRYELGSVAGAKAVRGAVPATAPLMLSPSARVEIVARPATKVQGQVAFRVLFARGSEVHRWNIDAQISPDGAVRMARLSTGPLPVEPGAWELLIAIARPEAMPEQDAAILAAAGGEGALQVLRIPATVVR